MITVRSSTWVLIVLLIAIVSIFSLARILAIALFVCTLLSILLSPIVDKLSRKIPRGSSVAVTLVVFIIIAVAGISWIASNVAPGFAKLVYEIPNFVREMRSLPNVVPIPAEIADYVNGAIHDAANIAIGIVKSSAGSFLQAVSGVIELIVIPVITFYFLKDGEKLISYFTRYLNQKESLRIMGILNEIKTVLRNYIQGQMVVSFISGFVVCLYFWIMGLPYMLVFAAISAVAELAPVVGPAVATILASILAYSYSPALAVKTLIFYIILLKVNHNLVYPALIGKATKLHPLVIVSGVLFFGHIFGVLGMILAVPVLAIIKIIFEHYVGRNENSDTQNQPKIDSFPSA